MRKGTFTMNYIDGFIIPVATKDKGTLCRVFTYDFGTLQRIRCTQYRRMLGDDVQPPGKLTSFPQAVMLKEDETVVFSWMTWPSKGSTRRGGGKDDGRSLFCPLISDAV